jgi:hypothetical protein
MEKTARSEAAFLSNSRKPCFIETFSDTFIEEIRKKVEI